MNYILIVEIAGRVLIIETSNGDEADTVFKAFNTLDIKAKIIRGSFVQVKAGV